MTAKVVRQLTCSRTENLKATIITAILFLTAALTTSVGRVEAGVYPETPNADGSCNDGWASTPIGCCPLGTENVHNFCESPEEHDQATNSYLACLAAAAAQDHGNPAQYAIDAANCASGGG
jgi:hypothetical protein